MLSPSETLPPHAARAAQTLSPPPVFRELALLGCLGIALFLLASVLLVPSDKPAFHFGEEGAVTALSSILLAMSSVLALLVFYLGHKDLHLGTFLWLLLSVGFLLLSLDELLMFHERGGDALKANGFGDAGVFRAWDDLIVALYGVVALGVAALFWREFMKCPITGILFAVGFAFYLVHTTIDSIIPASVWWKDYPEEGAKLLCVFSMFLAVSAYVLALAEPLLGGDPNARPGKPARRGNTNRAKGSKQGRRQDR